MSLSIGVMEGVTNAQYHGDREFISSTGLKLILRDPEQFYKTYVLGEKQERTDSLDFGNLVHTLALEPHELHNDYAVFTGATRRGKEWDEFNKTVAGRIIVTQSQVEKATTMVENLKRAEVDIHGQRFKVWTFLEKGNAEQTFGTILNGVKVKVKADYNGEHALIGVYISDLKTTSKDIVTGKDAMEACKAWDYDLSAALYVDAVASLIKVEKPIVFIFIFMNKANGNVFVAKASEEFIHVGREKYREALERLKRARATGIYYTKDLPEIPACPRDW